MVAEPGWHVQAARSVGFAAHDASTVLLTCASNPVAGIYSKGECQGM